MGEDVYDLSDEDRECLHDLHEQRAGDNFQSVGMDDYTATDRVIGGNGDRYFVTSL